MYLIVPLVPLHLVGGLSALSSAAWPDVTQLVSVQILTGLFGSNQGKSVAARNLVCCIFLVFLLFVYLKTFIPIYCGPIPQTPKPPF